MALDPERTNDANESGAALIATARRLAEALEARRRHRADLEVACGVAWALVDLLAEGAP